jgi:alkylhydroperoxidase family enzyme
LPRVSYAEPSAGTAEQIGARRGGVLTPLDLLLSHNQALALGWDRLVGGVRSAFTLRGDVRELIILRVGRLNHAPYEWDAHLPVALRAGLPQGVIDRLERDAATTGHDAYDAVLAYVDAMTKDVQVSEEVFDGLRAHHPESEIVEITATVAVYNMVSRFLVALDVRTADRESASVQIGRHG